VSAFNAPQTFGVAPGLYRLNYGDYEDNVTAVGSTQGTAYALTKRVTRVTGGNGAGVVLPTATQGDCYLVLNESASNPAAGLSNAINVYPPSGDSIYPLGANTRNYQSANTAVFYEKLGSTYWRALTVDMKSDHISRTIGDSIYFYGVVTIFSAFSASSTVDFTGTTTIGSGGTFRSRMVPTVQTTDLTLTDAMCGRNYNNSGASGAMVFTLPTAVAGQIYHARVVAAQYVRFTAAGSSTIYLGSTVSAAGGYIRSNVAGSTVTLECQVGGSSGVWVATDYTGTWTVDV